MSLVFRNVSGLSVSRLKVIWQMNAKLLFRLSVNYWFVVGNKKIGMVQGVIKFVQLYLQKIFYKTSEIKLIFWPG